MDDLPELPFEQVLSYLNLKDRLKARAVSRAWRNKFDRYPVKTLCFSSRPSDFIDRKIRWVSGAFAENFINSTRFASFFDTFGQTILSSLKHLRLCNIHLSEEDSTALPRTLNSFRQLEQLDIIRARLKQPDVFKLSLPMLSSLLIDNMIGIQKLTLEAPRLRDVKILRCYNTGLRVEIVHGESVERLLDDRQYTEVKKLTNLQHLYVGHLPWTLPTLLSSLQQLKKIHTNHPNDLSELFEEKQRLGRADLKIYLCGLLLNGPDDPAMNALRGSYSNLSGESFVCLAENPSRRADKIPFYSYFYYSNIEAVALGLEVNLLKLLTDLYWVTINRPVENIERFLDLLKNCKNIVELQFRCDQPQDLFDRLPEHCAVQSLSIDRPPTDLAFLFRLKHLIELYLGWSIDRETVRKAFDELPALSYFTFRYGQKDVSIQIDQSKQFQVSVDEQKTFSDLNAVIEFIFGKEKPSRPKKRKAEALK